MWLKWVKKTQESVVVQIQSDQILPPPPQSKVMIEVHISTYGAGIVPRKRSWGAATFLPPDNKVFVVFLDVTKIQIWGRPWKSRMISSKRATRCRNDGWSSGFSSSHSGIFQKKEGGGRKVGLGGIKIPVTWSCSSETKDHRVRGAMQALVLCNTFVFVCLTDTHQRYRQV